MVIFKDSIWSLKHKIKCIADIQNKDGATKVISCFRILKRIKILKFFQVF